MDLQCVAEALARIGIPSEPDPKGGLRIERDGRVFVLEDDEGWAVIDMTPGRLVEWTDCLPLCATDADGPDAVAADAARRMHALAQRD